MAIINKILIPFAILLNLHLISVVSGDSDFIRTSCNATRFPDLCYTSLSKYANSVKQDPAALVTVALEVSFSNAQKLASYTLKLSRATSNNDGGSDSTSATALHDCASLFLDAATQVRDSMRQMKRLDRTGPDSIRAGMSDVQTWMSSALTNGDTCVDGFDAAADGDLKTDVVNRSNNVRQLTSIALALANNYVATLGSH